MGERKSQVFSLLVKQGMLAYSLHWMWWGLPTFGRENIGLSGGWKSSPSQSLLYIDEFHSVLFRSHSTHKTLGHTNSACIRKIVIAQWTRSTPFLQHSQVRLVSQHNWSVLSWKLKCFISLSYRASSSQPLCTRCHFWLPPKTFSKSKSCSSSALTEYYY